MIERESARKGRERDELVRKEIFLKSNKRRQRVKKKCVL